MYSILLVDDDLDVVEIYAEFLEQLGYSVTSAPDGEKALALAAVLKPDLIITDFSMPRMNGLEFCRRIRADEQLRKVPIIVHSGEVGLLLPRGESFLAKTGDLRAFKAVVARVLLARIDHRGRDHRVGTHR
ncbi:Response regulator receiver domain-containing protein [Stigmatella aurantiaca]|uniref:Response regulator receiver domain-containing protein n=1 Tax=Stigmatella aurantiaca TaxID=41 RepID=A0A1H7WYX3_STIAU|nr:response regulator [Stigmatella aurantiaca]SEM26167.1 Response regulator receiver domain-containing protein [Stigmatella aurantiaca]